MIRNKIGFFLDERRSDCCVEFWSASTWPSTRNSKFKTQSNHITSSIIIRIRSIHLSLTTKASMEAAKAANDLSQIGAKNKAAAETSSQVNIEYRMSFNLCQIIYIFFTGYSSSTHTRSLFGCRWWRQSSSFFNFVSICCYCIA